MNLRFTEVLTIMFIVFKVFNLVTWSWWVVFSPTLISILLGVITALLKSDD